MKSHLFIFQNGHLTHLNIQILKKSRRVDFWCLNRDGKNGNPLNYFIEIKKGWYCYYPWYYDNDKLYYNERNVRENIYQNLDADSNLQLITSTWHLPRDIESQWDKSKCKFITIAGIVTNKSNDSK